MYQSTFTSEHPGSGIAVFADRAGYRMRALIRTPRTWLQRSEQRRALSQLSRRQLDDAGLTSQQLYDEVHKPFWRA